MGSRNLTQCCRRLFYQLLTEWCGCMFPTCKLIQKFAWVHVLAQQIIQRFEALRADLIALWSAAGAPPTQAAKPTRL